MTPVEGVLATHPIVSAIPFFVPTFIVVAVIAVVVWRDRRRGDDETGRTGEAGEGAGERTPGAGERSDAA
ncbi:hypothetical protein [Actinomadura kijaniata]|uniref:hypothetical protein n=1 Tax=Actinomadura kijaniata TaxID=46161 RepID=UPI000830ABCC|nr:hypothetical protein [Actinomadura kijaniata]